MVDFQLGGHTCERPGQVFNGHHDDMSLAFECLIVFEWWWWWWWWCPNNDRWCVDMAGCWYVVSLFHCYGFHTEVQCQPKGGQPNGLESEHCSSAIPQAKQLRQLCQCRGSGRFQSVGCGPLAALLSFRRCYCSGSLLCLDLVKFSIWLICGWCLKVWRLRRYKSEGIVAPAKPLWFLKQKITVEKGCCQRVIWGGTGLLEAHSCSWSDLDVSEILALGLAAATLQICCELHQRCEGQWQHLKRMLQFSHSHVQSSKSSTLHI